LREGEAERHAAREAVMAHAVSAVSDEYTARNCPCYPREGPNPAPPQAKLIEFLGHNGIESEIDDTFGHPISYTFTPQEMFE
jgi:hypothetical protein